MTYDVIVADEAARQIETHVYFVADISTDAAYELNDTLEAAIVSLRDMPERNPFFNGPYLPANKYHKMVISKRYLILYQIRDRFVYVDYVLDCRQDYRWLVKGSR